MPVAACLSMKVKDFPAPTAGMVNVQGVDAVKVAVRTVPAVIARVDAAPTVPSATTDSV